MAIWAMADLHLSSAVNKPMDIFGPEWENHTERIQKGWEKVVDREDLVIIPGDISWAINLEEVQSDLNFLASLPGRKLIIRGNHDYWWDSLSKIRKVLPPGIHPLQNDHFVWGDYTVCGSRGWICPGDTRYDPVKDEKIYLREVQRLKLSLQSVGKSNSYRIIVALHFPPFNVKNESSGFTELLSEYNADVCIYGHLHSEAKKYAFEGLINKTNYVFAAADKLNFTPVLIAG